MWAIWALLLCGATCAAQGLEPPPGPIAPTMKPLSDVEPRTPVNAVNTPGDENAAFVITRPGSYYLTASIVGEEGKSGIEIDASHVTLDLAGFDVRGVKGAVSGVRARAGQTNVSVRNGSTHAWPIVGVDVSEAPLSAVDDERSVGNGVGVLTGAYSSVRRCVATHNAGGGIMTGRSVTLDDCTASFNTGLGVYVLETSHVRRCTFEGNTTDGLYLDGAGSIVTGCIGVGNGRHGIAVIYGGAMTDCTMDNNLGDGFWSLPNTPGTWLECRATGNVGDGIDAGDGSSVSRCVVMLNGGDGVRTRDRVSVRECQAVAQVQGAGIRVTGTSSRVEGNTVTGNGVGVVVEGTGSLVVRNSASANKAGFEIGPGNAFGPIVNVVGSGDLGAVSGAGHPLVNLVY